MALFYVRDEFPRFGFWSVGDAVEMRSHFARCNLLSDEMLKTSIRHELLRINLAKRQINLRREVLDVEGRGADVDAGHYFESKDVGHGESAGFHVLQHRIKSVQ